MTLFLNLLLFTIGMASFWARMLEIDYLYNNLDLRLVSDPILLGIVFLIILCSTNIITANKHYEGFRATTLNKIMSLLAGALFLTYYGLNFGSTVYYDMFILLAGIGFIIYSFSKDTLSAKNLLYIIPLSVFTVGLSLQTIVFDVSSTNDTFYLFESLSSAVILLLLLALFRSINFPTKASFPSLYFFGFSAFLLMNITYLSNLVRSILNNTFTTSNLVLNLGFIFIGLFGLTTAIAVSSYGKSILEDAEIEDELEELIEADKEETIDTSNNKESAVLSLFSISNEDVENLEKTATISLENKEDEKVKSISDLFSVHTQYQEDMNENDTKQISSQTPDKSISISGLFNSTDTLDTPKNQDNTFEIQSDIKFAPNTQLDNSINEENLTLPKVSISSLFSNEELEIIDNMKTANDSDIENLDNKETAISISSLFSLDDTDSNKGVENNITESNENNIKEQKTSISTIVTDKQEKPLESDNSIRSLFSTKAETNPSTSDISKREIIAEDDNSAKEISDKNPDAVHELFNNTTDIEPLNNNYTQNATSSASNTFSTPASSIESDTLILKKGEKFVFKADKSSPKKKSSEKKILFKKD